MSEWSIVTIIFVLCQLGTKSTISFFPFTKLLCFLRMGFFFSSLLIYFHLLPLPLIYYLYQLWRLQFPSCLIVIFSKSILDFPLQSFAISVLECIFILSRFPQDLPINLSFQDRYLLFISPSLISKHNIHLHF